MHKKVTFRRNGIVTKVYITFVYLNTTLSSHVFLNCKKLLILHIFMSKKNYIVFRWSFLVKWYNEWWFNNNKECLQHMYITQQAIPVYVPNFITSVIPEACSSLLQNHSIYFFYFVNALKVAFGVKCQTCLGFDTWGWAWI